MTLAAPNYHDPADDPADTADQLANTPVSPRVLRRFLVYPDGTVFGPSGRRLSPFPVKGYLRVNRYEAGRFYAEPIHRLVCEAYHGPAPEGEPHARHHDGNPLNNNETNLSWSDLPTNEADKIIHGTALLGVRHPQAKLTDDDVRAIRSMDESAIEIAPLFGVHPSTIRVIRRRKTWRHI